MFFEFVGNHFLFFFNFVVLCRFCRFRVFHFLSRSFFVLYVIICNSQKLITFFEKFFIYFQKTFMVVLFGSFPRPFPLFTLLYARVKQSIPFFQKNFSAVLSFWLYVILCNQPKTYYFFNQIILKHLKFILLY